MELLGKKQKALVNSLNTPEKVKRFIDGLEYNEGDWLTIPEVLEKKKAACLEAALLSVLVLRHHGYKAYLLDLEAVRDEDHVLCVYKESGMWGAIAKSKFINLRHRETLYSTTKELAKTYYEHYFNFFGELTLRRYSVPISIEALALENDVESFVFVDKVADALVDARHFPIVRPHGTRRVSPEKFWSEIRVIPKKTRIGRQYEKARIQAKAK